MDNKFTYENHGTNTYLVYEIGEEDEIDSMSLGMLTHNKIDGLAETSFTQVDTTKYIRYNVSARVSVSQFFSGPVNRKRLLGVFTGIVDAMLSVEDYMIDPDSILLDMDYIFADVSSCETVLICLPVESMKKANDLGTFFKNVMFSTRFDQTENCDHVAEIINYLNSAPVFSLADFKALLNRLEKGRAAAPAPAPQPAPQVSQPAPAQPQVQQPKVQAQTFEQPVRPQPQVQQPQVPTTPVQPAVPEEPEEKMTLLYLLRHYDKENAAKYKAQQEAEKARKAAAEAAGLTEKPAKAKKEKGKKGKDKDEQIGFTVPGAPGGDLGFAIPGQKAPLPVPNTGAKPQPAVNSTPQPAAAPVVQPPVSPAPSAPQPRGNFGETTVLTPTNYGETTVLGAGGANEPVQLKPYLVRQKNNEKILIDKPVFRIGKERSYVDYFIGDNSAISRSHANIVTRDGNYFVVDTNSTNHTYVNGSMIGSNVEVQIENGNIIGFANESFEFKLM